MSCYLVKVKSEKHEFNKIDIKFEHKSSPHHYSSSSSCTAQVIKPVIIKHEIKKEEYDSDCDCNDCRFAQGKVITITTNDADQSTRINQTYKHEDDCGCSDCVQDHQVNYHYQANQSSNDQSVDLTDQPTCDNASRSSTPDWMPSIFSSDDDVTENDDEITQDERDDDDINVNDKEEEIHKDDDNESQVESNFILGDNYTSEQVKRKLKSHILMEMRHKCRIEGNNYTSEQVKRKLKSHILMEMKHKCRIEGCFMAFNLSSDLKQHMTVHTCADAFDDDFNPKSKFITVHLNCLDCSKTFKTKLELKRHQLKAHRIQRYRCVLKDCSASFYEKKQFSKHISVEHHNCQTWPCRDCDHQMNTYNNLSSHFRYKHQKGRFVCADTGCTVETDTIRNMDTHTRVHQATIHRCSTSGCNKGFKERYFLLEHERTHTRERPFACAQCDKSCFTNQQLKYHIRAKHQSRKPYCCKWESCQHENSYLACIRKHVRAHFEKAGDDVQREINDFIERHFEPVKKAASGSKGTSKNKSNGPSDMKK